jgi:amino acid permease
MRKLITTAITTTTLITIVWGTAAFAVLSQPPFATPAASAHNLSTHISHDGRTLRPGRAPLFTL